MKLLGFNLTRINVEKRKDLFSDIKINNNLNIIDVKVIEQSVFKSKDEMISVHFKYVVSYDPDAASVEMDGKILLGVDSKLSKDILRQWKDKKLPEDFRIALFNIVFRKAGLKAAQLEDEMGLPLHIQMPFIRKEDGSNQAGK